MSNPYIGGIVGAEHDEFYKIVDKEPIKQEVEGGDPAARTSGYYTTKDNKQMFKIPKENCSIQYPYILGDERFYGAIWKEVEFQRKHAMMAANTDGERATIDTLECFMDETMDQIEYRESLINPKRPFQKNIEFFFFCDGPKSDGQIYVNVPRHEMADLTPEQVSVVFTEDSIDLTIHMGDVETNGNLKSGPQDFHFFMKTTKPIKPAECKFVVYPTKKCVTLVLKKAADGWWNTPGDVDWTKYPTKPRWLTKN